MTPERAKEVTRQQPHYCDGRWGAYRAWERGESVSKSVEDALNAYNAAMHAYVSTWPSTVKAFPQ